MRTFSLLFMAALLGSQVAAAPVHRGASGYKEIRNSERDIHRAQIEPRVRQSSVGY